MNRPKYAQHKCRLLFFFLTLLLLLLFHTFGIVVATAAAILPNTVIMAPFAISCFPKCLYQNKQHNSSKWCMGCNNFSFVRFGKFHECFLFWITTTHVSPPIILSRRQIGPRLCNSVMLFVFLVKINISMLKMHVISLSSTQLRHWLWFAISAGFCFYIRTLAEQHSYKKA